MLISIGVPVGEATGALAELTGADEDPPAADDGAAAEDDGAAAEDDGAAAEELPELAGVDDDPLALLLLLLHADRLPATRPAAMSAIPQLFNLTTSPFGNG
jgi:hypothetical protein